ncbi:CHAT domain-containing protein [Cupriavidus consociatus]|uniref:CHAT domain-containing protein n=1 Tax=Cupriavidus consociatus TaxID=2821357 RepID=UPI001AE44EF2|nr:MULTISPECIES: CHAT domain-containing protein [unclassified Cupriavidus]MBP0624737.1 CHAT domain-containing protein [Cupriavidus sp. LEh25]MDK2661451.1 CHAT domain-containing protein [Cupriavidus sp. LEh21]
MIKFKNQRRGFSFASHTWFIGIAMALAACSSVYDKEVHTIIASSTVLAAVATAVAAPPPPSRADGPVVYNASLSPALPRSSAFPKRQVLKSGQATTLRFHLGPQDPLSILEAKIAATEIRTSKADVPLSVVLACSFCAPRADSLRHIVYKPDARQSNDASFAFTPLASADGSAYTATLQILIINDTTGTEHDRLSIDVAVDAAKPATAAVGSTVSTRTVKAVEPSEASPAWQPDLILYAYEELGRYVSIEIEPVSAEMKALIGSLTLDASGARRKFRSGVDDATMVDAMTKTSYGVMSAVSLQGEFLDRLSATGVDAAVSDASQTTLKLNDAEAKVVAETIAASGRQLYRHLFTRSQESDLRTAIRQIESAADQPRARPLRLKVITDRISLPWQYLHPVGPSVDPNKFWGMRFSLSVLRTSTGGAGRGAQVGQPTVPTVVFARYGKSADDSVHQAIKQIAQLKQITFREPLVVDSGPKLLNDALTRDRRQVSAILTFLHASSGAQTPADYMSGPQLEFNTGDLVTSENLENLLNVMSAEELESRVPYLTSMPLVILNACETGPSTHLPHVKLQDALFLLGAEGVVVTEVSVWIPLGHEVATRLIGKLGKGDAVSDALTMVRRELYAEKKNPLGLLYAYYGDPAATLRY